MLYDKQTERDRKHIHFLYGNFRFNITKFSNKNMQCTAFVFLSIPFTDNVYAIHKHIPILICHIYVFLRRTTYFCLSKLIIKVQFIIEQTSIRIFCELNFDYFNGMS